MGDWRKGGRDEIGPTSLFGDHFSMGGSSPSGTVTAAPGRGCPLPPARLSAPDTQCTSYSVVVTISLLFSS